MIELFDAERLLPRRDHSLPVATAALLATLAAMAGYGWTLHTRLHDAEARRADLARQLKTAAVPQGPNSALLADLQREAERLEAEASGDPRSAPPPGPSPSQWMLRLGELASNEVGLSKIEVERAGAVRIEGMAQSAQAVSGFLQAWDQQQAQSEALSPVRARAIEVRQDINAAPLLRFQLRATAPPTQVRP